MKVFYDHQIQTLQVKGGISRYFNFLERELSKDQNFNIINSTIFSNNLYIEGPTEIKKFFRDFEFKGKYFLLNAINQYITSKKLKNLKYDLFHPTYYDPYFLDFVKTPYIVTVHDMIHEIFPEYFPVADQVAAHKRKTILNAERIIAISNTTKKDLVNILKVKEDIVDVVHHAYYPTSENIESRPFNCPNRYVLFVGDRHTYKSFKASLPGLGTFLKRNNIILYCAGGNRFSQSEIELINHLDLNHFIVQKNVSEKELNWLYKNAIFFIFPSKYEGFGLPILEAFKNKCPCLLYSSECFREIASTGALFFKEHSELDMICEELYKSEQLQNELIVEGERLLLKFSPVNTLTNTKNVYRKAISTKNAKGS